jgi:hypothetical protein
MEGLLKQRLTLLNAAKDYAAGLACAKSLFNVSSMAHTSDAITLLDRQFLALGRKQSTAAIRLSECPVIAGEFWAMVSDIHLRALRNRSEMTSGFGKRGATRDPFPWAPTCF